MKELLGQNSFWLVNKTLTKHLRSIEASLLLSDLITRSDYWSNKVDDFDGWFFVLQSEIEEDLFLSPHKQNKALSILENSNLVETKFKGIPKKKYYKVNQEEVLSIFGLYSKKVNNKTLKNLSSGSEKKSGLLISNKELNNNNNSISSFSNERGGKELPNSLQKDHFADAGETINSNNLDHIADVGKKVDHQSLNEKEENKKEKAETLESYDLPTEKLEVLIEWLDYRKEIKKTIKAKSTIRGLVKKFEEHDISILKYVVSSSINNGWQGLFWERVANYKEGNKNDSTRPKKTISLSQALKKK